MAKPLVPIDRRSPPLPFTASTRSGVPVSGSGSSNLELVLPPPKLVIRRSAPRRFERYLRRSSGAPARDAASRSSHRSRRNLVATVTASDTGELHVLLEPMIVRVPHISGARFESFHRKRAVDDR